MDRFELHWPEVAESIAEFIRQQMRAAGRETGVLGLSGGIDSTTSAYVTARALGSDNLLVFMLPYETSAADSLEDAVSVAETLGVKYEVIEITPQVDAYFERFPDADRIRRANKMARERMSILYDQSERYHALVVGTGNRTEGLLGYTTLWGDMACAFNPLGGLYKTQVRRFAEYLGVSGEIIAKTPSADLWQGQTDEGELGFTYDEADAILYRVVEEGMTEEEVAEEGFPSELFGRVVGRMRAMEFKRRMPLCPPVQDLRAP